MKRIIIVGAGGFGREVAGWLEHIVAAQDLSIAGFVDDTLTSGDEKAIKLPYPFLGKIADYVVGTDDLFVVAIGEPKGKYRIAKELESRGAIFFSVIHPTSIVARTAKIGKGAILCPFALVSADVRVGDFVTINISSSIGHDAIIGAGCTLSSHIDITAAVELGSCVFVGTSASIVPGIKVGAGAKIGAGAVVVRNVKENATVYSMPAKNFMLSRR